MSDDYTPDEKTAREAWCEFLYLQSHGMKHVDDSGAEFDRFIATVKADALREAADEYATSNREQSHGVTSVLMFMHHRADRIEKGER